ncbi:MAG: hypothetical protein IJX30_04465 [Clostridia bacterium]|nr:hypothetical protein [Clostridia bacterium]
MQEIFHTLYQSYIQNQEFPFDYADEKYSKLLLATFQDFFSALPQDKKATFRDWEILKGQLNDNEKECAFIEGVKYGIRIILCAIAKE